jgi:hypothetical protein
MERTIILNKQEIQLALAEWAISKGHVQSETGSPSVKVRIDYTPPDNDPRGGGGDDYRATIVQEVKGLL